MGLFKERLTCSKFTILPIICCLTVLTYVDLFPDSIRYSFSYVAWVLVLIECLFAGRLILYRESKNYLLYGAVIFLFVLFLEIIGENDYLSSSIIYSILVSLLVFICGSFSGEKLTCDDTFVICRWYCIGAIIMAIVLFVQNISSGFGLTYRVYMSLNKNSVGQILSSAACIMILDNHGIRTKMINFLRFLCSIFLIVVLFLIRSRTCIICFSVSVILILFSKYTNRKAKRVIGLLLIVLFLFLMLKPNFRDILLNNILFANRDVTDINDLSSGRINIYKSFWPRLQQSPLTGVGSIYYESFYLSAILQFGVIVGGFVCGYVVYMLKIVSKVNKKIPYGQILLVISISYSINGLFEGLPPFGPGTKNFLLWLLLGLAISQSYRMDYSVKEKDVIL